MLRNPVFKNFLLLDFIVKIREWILPEFKKYYFFR